MKKFRQKMAEKAGFTLVELIVVIAILGILAGIAVPTYSAYIKKANDAAVATELSAVLTAAQAANATNINAINKISVTSAGVVTVTLQGGGALSTSYYSDFASYYGTTASATDNTSVTISGLATNMPKSVTYASGANWTSAAGWTAGT